MSVTETLSPKRLAGLPVLKIKGKEPKLNLGIYGDSGTGKTQLAASADEVPEMRPVLIIDVEGGTETLRNSYPEVDTVRVQSWQQVQDLYNELYRGKHGYNTVVVDSLTEVQKFSMGEIMREVVEKDAARDPDIPSMREWGKNLEQMRRFVRAFRDLDVHTIFTALVQAEKNERTGITTYTPSLSGKLRQEVAAFLDIVAYYYVKEVQDEDKSTRLTRVLLTRKTDIYIAKDRSNRLPMLVQDPTMRTLFDLMYNPDKKD
jgi:hypothetical protein